jgi:hypothetical protein
MDCCNAKGRENAPAVAMIEDEACWEVVQVCERNGAHCCVVTLLQHVSLSAPRRPPTTTSITKRPLHDDANIG